MKKQSMVWLYLALVFLVLTLYASYFYMYTVAAMFIGFAFLNLLLLFFDCQRNEICRMFTSAFTRFMSFFFLLLFVLAVSENIFGFMPGGLVRHVMLKFIWVWPILFLSFFPISKLFGKIVKAKKENSYNSVK